MDLRIALDDLQELSSGQVEAAAQIPRRNLYGGVFWGALGTAALVLAVGFFWLRSRPSVGVVPLRQQTFEAGMALMPALSPDGKLLVYTSDGAGDGVLDLWVKQVAGAE